MISYSSVHSHLLLKAFRFSVCSHLCIPLPLQQFGQLANERWTGNPMHQESPKGKSLPKSLPPARSDLSWFFPQMTLLAPLKAGHQAAGSCMGQIKHPQYHLSKIDFLTPLDRSRAEFINSSCIML